MNFNELESKYYELLPNQEILDDIQDLAEEGGANFLKATDQLKKILRPFRKENNDVRRLLRTLTKAITNYNEIKNVQNIGVKDQKFDNAIGLFGEVLDEIPAIETRAKKAYKLDDYIGRLNKLKNEVPTGAVEGIATAFEALVTKEKYNNIRDIAKKIAYLKDRLAFYENCLTASRSVCKVTVKNPIDGVTYFGSGFITPDNYLYTNYHVISHPYDFEAPTLHRPATLDELKSIAKQATIEFGFNQAGTEGNPANTYSLDTTDFLYSHTDDLDYVRVKVAGNPADTWGGLTIDPNANISIGMKVPIIQHPEGEYKKVMLAANQVAGYAYQNHKRILYTTNTERGSSGSPVFNLDWKVIALHHAAENSAANRGILFQYIWADIVAKGGASNGGNGGNLEGTTAPKPDATPQLLDPDKTRIFLLYDRADERSVDSLMLQLVGLRHDPTIAFFDMQRDQRLMTIGNATEVVEHQIYHADIVLAFITPHFFGIPYKLWKKIENHHKIPKLPLLINRTPLEKFSNISKYRTLPIAREFASDFRNTNDAYYDIAVGIMKVVENLQ